MIVDSPGVGESDVMSSFVLNYLPRAFCFMYVICAVNAGGIQQDRVRTSNTGFYKPDQNYNKILERDWLSPIKNSTPASRSSDFFL